MKAYLFDTETGLYEGETFTDAATLGHAEGLTRVPPPDFGHGQVPVFDHRRQSWEVIPTGMARQRLASQPAGAPE